jgi:proline dehydrogenase
MLRSIMLYLSASKAARRIITHLPFAARVSRRFVAGETIEDAIRTAQALNRKGLLVTLDHLGENVHTEADANRATEDVLALLDRVGASGVKSGVSVKLTQLGLDIGEDLCVSNMRRILSKAREHGRFVRIDMESSAYTEKTLRVFRTVRHDYGFDNTGIVIQAYLFRSEKDMRELADEGASVRLCKGAYKEPPDVAFPQKADVDRNYVKLVQLYMDGSARAKGAFLAVASHDEKMIEAAKAFAAQQDIPKDRYEFQMLYGIRGQTQERLAAEGYRMRVYVPYGTEWYPYFMRRLAERPANVIFLARNAFRA